MGGNPLRFIDPEGLQAGAIGVGGAAASGAGIACMVSTVGIVSAVGYSSYWITDTYINPWLQPIISRRIDNLIFSENSNKPPNDSVPINETPWSGDHAEIKGQSDASPTDNVRISSDGEVWVERPNGSWENTGNAHDMIGGNKASGRRGKDREPSWKQERGKKYRGDWQ